MRNRSCFRHGASLAPLALVAALLAAGLDGSAIASDLSVPAGAPALDDGGAHIIVTARKRDERLVDVPAAISALSGATLEAQRIQDATGLIDRVPGLYLTANALSPGSDFMALVIRGVGSQSVGPPAVGTFVNGVYVPALGFDTGFLDVERVEILKGPQGTLFGRNTQGGALSIVTRKPEQAFRAKAQLGYDSFDTFSALASISGGLSADIAGSLAVEYRDTGGFIANRGVRSVREAETGRPAGRIAADDMRGIAMRAALRWRPDDRTDISLSADLSDRKGNEPLPGIPLGGLPGERGHPFAGMGRYAVFTDFQREAHYRNHGAALAIDHDLGFAALTALTGYRRLTSALPFDFDGGTDLRGNDHDLRTRQRFLSQELRLAGEAMRGDLRWLAGLYAFDERDDTFRHYDFATVPIFTGIHVDVQDQRIKRRGYAAFGEVSYDPVDRLEVTAGLRYSWEKVDSRFVVDAAVPDLFGPGVDYVIAGTDRRWVRFTNLSPMVSLRYAIRDALSVYARFARGFRAGGFPRAPADMLSNAPFKAESSDNYEVGLKGEVLDGRIGFDLAGFRIDITDQQLIDIALLEGDVPIAIVSNAGKSRSRGFEASVSLRPLAGLVVSAGVGYTDARYRRYVDPSGRDRGGEPFPFTPRWTSSISSDYAVPLGRGWTAFLGGTFSRVGAIRSGTGVAPDLQFPVPAYSQLDLRAGVEKGGWRIDAHADNVTDNYIVTRVFNSFFFPDPPARPHAMVKPPRRLGIRVTRRL